MKIFLQEPEDQNATLSICMLNPDIHFPTIAESDQVSLRATDLFYPSYYCLEFVPTAAVDSAKIFSFQGHTKLNFSVVCIIVMLRNLALLLPLPVMLIW